MDLLLEVPTSDSCSDNYHSFETHHVLPIPVGRRCICGKYTWDEAVELARAQHHMHADAASAAAKAGEFAPALSSIKPAGSQAAPVM